MYTRSSFISDHSGWNNAIEHETILQAKFNKYLAFVASREPLERYPDGKGRPVAVVFMHYPTNMDGRFLPRPKDVIQSAGFSFRHQIFPEDHDN